MIPQDKIFKMWKDLRLEPDGPCIFGGDEAGLVDKFINDIPPGKWIIGKDLLPTNTAIIIPPFEYHTIVCIPPEEEKTPDGIKYKVKSKTYVRLFIGDKGKDCPQS